MPSKRLPKESFDKYLNRIARENWRQKEYLKGQIIQTGPVKIVKDDEGKEKIVSTNRATRRALK